MSHPLVGERVTFLDEINRDLKRKIDDADRQIKRMQAEIHDLHEQSSDKDKRVGQLSNLLGVISNAVEEDTVLASTPKRKRKSTAAKKTTRS